MIPASINRIINWNSYHRRNPSIRILSTSSEDRGTESTTGCIDCVSILEVNSSDDVTAREYVKSSE